MKLSASQEGRLVRLARDGDLKARDRLADEFKGLVQGVARSHSHAPGDREELESAGAEALVARLAKLADYDSNQGRLSTWLTPTIEGAIGKAAAYEARNRSVLESRRLDDEGEPQSEIERYAKPDTNFAALLDENDDDEELARPGADSARDPYLRTDRFPDIKEALLAFLRKDDPQAAVHEGTWDKMTRSPALVSLLRRVHSGEAHVARLAQEYRNLAPVLPSARAPRIFTQRDGRSDALAGITRRAAVAGSLPERAQLAALGVSDAVSAVAHFRRWVLGGEPRELWPDLAERLLAARAWVEEQAKRESAPDPEHILAYGDGKLRAIARGGALDTLKQCACQLVHDWGWSEEQAVRFILTGFAENVPKLRGAVRAGGLYGTHARIVMDIDPRTSPTEVASLYAKWRAALALMLGVRAYPDRDRPMKERTLALAVFVEENWQPGGSWRDLLASWNESHPAGRFPDGMQDPGANNFANHARQAWSRLSGTSWPTTTHAKSIHRDHGTGRPNAFSAGPDSP
jgi:hypothetical protein